MRILVTGGTGFIGQALLPALVEDGHAVLVLTRQALEGDVNVSYVNKLDDIDAGVDAVINLAGASLAGKRWSAAYKEEIVSSRLQTTSVLGAFFASGVDAPQVWLNASAIGFYGPSGDEPLAEDAAAGSGFSAELCQAWEAAAVKACPEATRLCLLRLGVVLDKDDGAYPQMAAPFKLGVANWVGSGSQYLSWVHRQDVVAAMHFLIREASLAGPFNVTAPEPVTSRAFCDAMKAAHRTWLTLPMPAPAMRLLVGEMADELLLTGQRVLPKALEESGFAFAYPRIDAALSAIEGRST